MRHENDQYGDKQGGDDEQQVVLLAEKGFLIGDGNWLEQHPSKRILKLRYGSLKETYQYYQGVFLGKIFLFLLAEPPS